MPARKSAHMLPRANAARCAALGLAVALCGHGLVAEATAQYADPTTQVHPVSVIDDQNRTISLPRPALRAITLSPHATELVYAAGAGTHLAGTVDSSNYPANAQALPRIGDGLHPDPERIVALQPDLLIAWLPAQAESLARPLAQLGTPLFYSNPAGLDSLPNAIVTLGRLFGTEETATRNATALQQRLDTLRSRYRDAPPVRVFILVGSEPLYTLNGAHIISQAVELCGGINIFSTAPAAAPQVSPEAVLRAQPDIVLMSTQGLAALHGSRDIPSRHSDATTTLYGGQVMALDADLLYRPGPRLVDAAEQICQRLENIRANEQQQAGTRHLQPAP